MTTTIRANCPDCGDVAITEADITVRICDYDETGTYYFRCPECFRATSKNASDKIIELLVGTGVHVERWQLPAELGEMRVGEPWVPDDLIDFHLLLQDDGWFDDLSALDEAK